jgi:hypothetical protein
MRSNLSQWRIHQLRAASHNAPHRLMAQWLGNVALVDAPEISGTSAL